MDIQLIREIRLDNCIIGKLRIADIFWCWTLEDIERREKIFGETAIAVGRYEIIIDYSEHFDCDMLHILNVPNFEGIRIHWGNTSADTAGCVLVGNDADLENGEITRSREAYAELTSIVKPWLKRDSIFIEITDAQIIS